MGPEGPLWDLQKRRRAEALPLMALQLMAEASARGIPSFVRDDGLVQLGYGARSWAFDPARKPEGGDTLAPEAIGIGPPPSARTAEAPEVPWEQLGPIPIVAVAGGEGRDLAAQLVAAAIAEQGRSGAPGHCRRFPGDQEALADPAATFAVAGLDGAGIAMRGLAFERCAYSAVVDLPTALPPGLADHAELARALGVAMLVTDPAGAVALNADIPEIAALAEYAPCPIIYISAMGENATVGFHRASGGAALFVRDGAVVAAKGVSEQPVVAADLPPAQLLGALAAFALLWTMGLSWEQIIDSVMG